jgi:hypothetical protein
LVRSRGTVQTVKARSTQTIGSAENPISPAQLAANRANSQLSTGPATAAGKRISSLNAVKTGLTGQTVLLPSDDAALYERHVQRFIADHQPEGDRESELVQSMADAQWRMNRIPGLEMAVFARGRIQFAEKFAEYDERMATALTDAETLVVYQRELRNLNTQETRIRRQYQKDLAELKELQTQRASANVPALPPPPPLPTARDIDPNGFEFSKTVEEIEEEILTLEAERAA